MSDNSNATNSQPAFSIQKLYIKDCSFENPNSPEVFAIQDVQPKIEMNMGVENRQVDDNHWEVVLKINIQSRDQTEDKLMFEVELEHAGVFFIRNVPAEQMGAVLAIECPTIIFPYTRQLVSQLTTDGGFMPLILEPMNFNAAYEASQAQQQERMH